nr:diguanylate cyclase [Desulfobacteraceae bacterium]
MRHKGLPSEPDHLLIVDDDRAILNFLDDFFTYLKFPHRLAGDGVEALAILEKESVNIIITDMLMPNMDGMELIRRVKERWPEIDIIAMTGYAKDFHYIDVIKAGASDFIQKPFSLDELDAKIYRLIEERRLKAELKRLSLRDSLTDLYNRRFFDQRLREEAERSSRQDYDLYVAIVDIDGFKELNDQKGHDFGDKILIGLASVLNRSTRKSVDIVCRIGGDEFAVIIPQADAKQVTQIGERIRKNYLAYKDRGETTLSIGIAGFAGAAGKAGKEDVKKMIREADETMYVAKNAGGNKVLVRNIKKQKDPPPPPPP